jgi:hypothetical protein
MKTGSKAKEKDTNERNKEQSKLKNKKISE